ncbi:PREDICTED: linoleate 9S-lipoxygenase 1-like [Tarenaya hassleriana]|uniref:linoleate 9S-lipoxygenase 1-like n=1 Tax=Tarenaya hassleriana TaxID=28532 RepID=UPI00053C32DE|nr:PREDICTED: linoleate 9S-lipoxygenase 1-like [Tarenaya hassleriana]
MIGQLVDLLSGGDDSGAGAKVKGTVVLMKKNVLDFNDFNASFLDRLTEFLGNKVTLRLISSDVADSGNGSKGKLGKPAHLEEWITTITPLTAGESAFKVTFDYENGFGFPGAFAIRNDHFSEFYLKSLTLEDVPGHGRVHFLCNSWVYPSHTYEKDRVFFSNKTYLPSQTPEPLVQYREKELVSLRGTGKGELKEGDRVYDYAYYNDLGDPPKNPRPVLGGSEEYPYPRRGRTGRKPTKEDPNTESRLPITSSLNVYVPRDERFGHLKMSDFLVFALKSIVQIVQPALEAVFDKSPNEFDSFEDVLKIYEEGIDLPNQSFFDNIRNNIPLELLREIFRTDGAKLLKYPEPQIIKEDKSAWRTDEEFAREMLAGLNPVVIRLLEEFPPKSKLDSQMYGNQTSTITKTHIEHNLEGLNVEEALEKARLFILDHHDTLMPYLRRVNMTGTKTYATRTLLFLKEDGTLKPLVIELSLPHPDGDRFGALSEVYTPGDGVQDSLWQLAKAYVGVNDSGNHQLISHWLNTHAVIEPFVIATNRQLSALHPVYKLLQPHYRDTMNINAFARQILINGGGILETTVYPAKYAMEMSSFIYKHYWTFPDQALPADLKKRGMAIEDPEAPQGLRLRVKDYPYAVDGLEIWSAIESWVRDYISFYYKTDDDVRNDTELQTWWKEIREEGHGDKKSELWWPKMQTRKELIDSCTIIIWIASALHASVNFGQYPIAGYMPNRPTISRQFMPEKGTREFEELEKNPDKVFLRTITAQIQTLLGISIIEILSRHSSDEVYLGQRDSNEWTTENEALEAFSRFGERLAEIERKIVERNDDVSLKNRNGPVKMPYTLMFPTSEGGITGKGIPNSVSI